MASTTRRHSRHWRSAVGAVASGALLLAGCVSSSEVAGDSGDAPSATSTSSSGATEAPSQDLAKFYDQDLAWESCGGKFECAMVTVPVEYAEPDGDTLELKLRKLPAAGSDDSLGSMFVNPGGPGGSGVDYVQHFASQVSDGITEKYDVIGFDPRGVGESTPLQCLPDPKLDEFVNTDPDPDTKAEAKEYARAARELGEACKKNTPGDLAAHVSTIEVGKDLDVLRALVGDEKLTYVGASYGTAIGATYAELFPENVGRFVLDGALDPSMSNREANLGQAKGFHTALVAYVENCIEQGSCPLGDDVDEGLKKISDLLQQLDKKPLPSGDPDRPVTEALGFYGIAVTLYNKDYWPLLTKELEAAFDGDGSQMLFLADQYLSRTAEGYKDNSAQVIYAVNCLDDPVQTTPKKIRGSMDEFLEVSPVFGRTFAWSPLSCDAWPIEPTLEPLEIDGEGADPIVVIGTTRDPATPYEWAQAMAKELDSGVLVTREGDGHTGYNMGNECVDDAVNEYLLEGTVPEDGLRC